MSRENAKYLRWLKIQLAIYTILLIVIIIVEIFLAPMFFGKVSKIKQTDMIEYAKTAWHEGLDAVDYSAISMDSKLLTNLSTLQTYPLKEITPMKFELSLKANIIGDTTVKIKENVFRFIDEDGVGRDFQITFYAQDWYEITHPFSFINFLKYGVLFILADIVFILIIVETKRELKNTKA